MLLSEILKILDAEPIGDVKDLNREIKMVYASDLMSDVLSFAKPEGLLLTGLTNPQVIRTAEMVDLSAICFVRGKRPEKTTIQLAKEKNIPLLSTKLPMYESCGKLYKVIV